MRSLAIFVWGLLIATATIVAVIMPRPAPSQLAVGSLPQNTLLLPGVLVPKDFEFKFVVAEKGIPAGAPFTAQDLSAEPVIPASQAGNGLVSIQVGWSDVLAGLNAGKTVRICRGASELASTTIIAVRCQPAGTPSRCEAIVAIPLASDGLIKELAKPEKLKVAGQC